MTIDNAEHYDANAAADALDSEQKIHALRFFLFAAIVLLVTFSVINLLLGNRGLATSEGLAAVLAVVVTSLIRKTSWYDLYSYLFVAVAAALLLVILLYHSPPESAFVWAGIFPIFSFFLLGIRRGLMAHIVFSVILFGALVLGMHGHGYVVTPRLLVNVGGALVVFGSFIYLYERAKESALHLLFHHSVSDALTETGNRRLFATLLQKEKSLAHRQVRPLSLIMLDIDHFKNVNDRFGHITGDAILKSFAGLIKDNLRQSDLLFRWGGEEFIILLPGNEPEAAHMLAEKIRIIIENHPFDPVGKMTASFGVTGVLPGESDEETIRRLDQALYRAKDHGRNRVEVA